MHKMTDTVTLKNKNWCVSEVHYFMFNTYFLPVSRYRFFMKRGAWGHNGFDLGPAEASVHVYAY